MPRAISLLWFCFVLAVSCAVPLPAQVGPINQPPPWFQQPPFKGPAQPASVSKAAGQQTPSAVSQASSDPQALAVVQAAITAMGGAASVAASQRFSLQGQMEGRVGNGQRTETLSSTASQSSNTVSASTNAAIPPSVLIQPRSLFVPALAGAILAKEVQDPNFTVKQAPASGQQFKVVIFSIATRSGASAPGQIWYFDSTTGLPARIEFIVPARVGPVESVQGVVMLSDYRTVGGVLYPFRIVTSMPRQNASETITLQAVTMNAPAPSGTGVAAGGAQ